MQNYLLVFGGRDFLDKTFMKTKLLEFMEEHDLTKDNTVVIEGGASGADTLANELAKELEIPFDTMKADWNDMSEPCTVKYNRYGAYNALAGFKRNSQMVELATHALGFWDTKSPGTKDSIKKINSKGIPLVVVEY